MRQVSAARAILRAGDLRDSTSPERRCTALLPTPVDREHFVYLVNKLAKPHELLFIFLAWPAPGSQPSA